MAQFADNKETTRVSRSVTRHFVNSGWVATEEQRSHGSLLRLSKRDILVLVKCLDTDIQRFLPVLDFIDRIEALAREHRLGSGDGIVFVVNHPLLGVSAGSLLSKGIVLLQLDELDALNNLEGLYHCVPDDLHVRDRLIAQGSKKLCNSLSVAAAKARDFDSARKWLELNLEGVRTLQETHFRLIELLKSLKDFDGAREAAKRSIASFPYNLDLLNGLRKIEVAAGNAGVLQELDERILQASEVRPNLESILAKQKPSFATMLDTAKTRRRNLSVSFFQSLFRREY